MQGAPRQSATSGRRPACCTLAAPTRGRLAATSTVRGGDCFAAFIPASQFRQRRRQQCHRPRPPYRRPRCRRPHQCLVRTLRRHKRCVTRTNHTVSSCPNPISGQVCTSVSYYYAQLLFSGEMPWCNCHPPHVSSPQRLTVAKLASTTAMYGCYDVGVQTSCHTVSHLSVWRRCTSWTPTPCACCTPIAARPHHFHHQ